MQLNANHQNKQTIGIAQIVVAVIGLIFLFAHSPYMGLSRALTAGWAIKEPVFLVAVAFLVIVGIRGIQAIIQTKKDKEENKGEK